MSLLQDLKFSARRVRKNPAVALSAILATGLGIGATSAMFGAADGILLHPLPFRQSDRLVNVWESAPTRNLPRLVAAPGNYYDWRTQNQSFSDIGAYQQATFNLASRDSEPERYLGAICDPGFFEALQVAPMLGRVITGEEDQPGRDGVVVLGFNAWQQRFGADTGIVGRQVEINGRSRTVIGGMPRGFEYPAKAVIRSPLALAADHRSHPTFQPLHPLTPLTNADA